MGKRQYEDSNYTYKKAKMRGGGKGKESRVEKDRRWCVDMLGNWRKSVERNDFPGWPQPEQNTA